MTATEAHGQLMTVIRIELSNAYHRGTNVHPDTSQYPADLDAGIAIERIEHALSVYANEVDRLWDSVYRANGIYPDAPGGR